MAHAPRDGDNGASLIARPPPSPVHVHLDDWVLCRIYNKKGVIERYDTVDSDVADVKPAPAAKNPRPGQYHAAGPAMKVELSDYGFYQHPSPPATEMLCFDRSGSADRDSNSNHSMPRLHTDSSSSERALSSPSPDFPSDMDYAESQHAAGLAGGWPGDDWGRVIDDDGFVIDGSLIFDPPSPGSFARDAAAFGDMLTYLQKLF